MTVQVESSEYAIEGILFDKDGTLMELDTLWSVWFDQVWREINEVRPIEYKSKQQVAASIGLHIESERISPLGPLAIGTLEDIAIILSYHLYSDGFPWNDAVTLVRQRIQHVHEHITWDELLEPVRYVERFLKQASERGVKLAVVTSDDTDIAKEHLQILQLDHYFDYILGSDQITNPKPFPEIGIKACRKMDVNPENVIVIGDTNADMNLGKNLNSQASIGIVHESKGKGEHLTDANHIVNHYDQLIIKS